MKKKSVLGIILVVLGVLFIITAFSFFPKKDYGSVVVGLLMGAGCILLGTKRIKNPATVKEKTPRKSFSEIRREEAAKREEELKRQHDEKVESFKSILSSIPKHDIEIGDNDLERCNLRDMPDIKISAISKTFNPSSLPAFVVIDTETTGLKASTDRIIELSAIIFEDFEPTLAWTTRLKIDGSIPWEASVINGIHDDDLKDAPTLDEVSQSFLDFVGQLPIVGYNLGFDLKFLFCSGIDIVSTKNKKYDVLQLVRRQYKHDIAGGFSLENVCSYHDIFYIPHLSLSDCYATGELFKTVIQDRTESFIS